MDELGEAEIQELLDADVAQKRALGGAIGGAIGGGAAGAVGGRSGGSRGARLGLKLTKLDSTEQELELPLTDELVVALEELFEGQMVRRDATDEPGTFDALGKLGTGAVSNPCVVTLPHDGRRLHVVAYAREGLIKQRTATKSLARLTEHLRARGLA